MFPPGATKYTDKDNGGMLVWSPYHSIPDAKCKFSGIECLYQQGSVNQFRMQCNLYLCLGLFNSHKKNQFVFVLFYFLMEVVILECFSFCQDSGLIIPICVRPRKTEKS